MYGVSRQLAVLPVAQTIRYSLVVISVNLYFRATFTAVSDAKSVGLNSSRASCRLSADTSLVETRSAVTRLALADQLSAGEQ